MHLLFGVLGPEGRAAPVFDHLVALTEESNPEIHPVFETAPGLLLGRHLRSFGRWDDVDGDLTLLVDGVIRSVDGRDTPGHGTSEAELAEVARLYRRHGAAIWERLEGSFCLIVRDRSTVLIGFDVGGPRSLYWWARDGVLAFHSHLMDVAPAYPGDLAVDPAGVASYLAHSLYPFGVTAFSGIGMLGAGQYLEVDLATGDARAEVHDHFRLDPIPSDTGRRIEVLADELNDLLADSFARCWRSAVNPVMPLSGGTDSRYLAALAVHLTGDPSLVPAITWGEDATRPGSDAIVAPQVAAALGMPHTWFEKPQVHTAQRFERAIYATNGEGDGAINYPCDHEFHERLLRDHGYRSLFRGDHIFGENQHIITHRAVLPSSGLSRIRLDPAYACLLGPELHGRMADAQDALLGRLLAGLKATTPHARAYELKYATTLRREHIASNTRKHSYQEVLTPFLERQVLDWVRRIPDRYRSQKRVFRLALARRFPELSVIPFATSHNLPDWDQRARVDPGLARFLREWFERPGWLDSIGATDRVVHQVELLGAEAHAASERAGMAGAWRPGSVSPAARRRLNMLLRDAARASAPGNLAREWTMERRMVSDRSSYDRLSRLAVVHELVGHAQARQARKPG